METTGSGEQIGVFTAEFQDSQIFQSKLWFPRVQALPFNFVVDVFLLFKT